MAQLNPIIPAMDRLASRVVGALHRLFGFQYSKNNEFYIYEASVTTKSSNAAVGDTFTTSIRMTQEADFVCTRIQANARVASTGILIGTSHATGGAAGDMPDAPFTLKITDGSTDRQLMNTNVDAALFCGTLGGLPGVMPKPRLFARNSTLSFEFGALKALTSIKLRVQLIGWKIYDVEALDLTSRRA